jgi:hypothetical protein
MLNIMLGGAARAARSATWNNGVRSALFWSRGKPRKRLDGFGRSQELPDAH